MREMKDSGIEWIGDIPYDWKSIQIKHLYNIVSGATPAPDAENWDGEVLWITPADYKTKDKYVSSGKRNISMQGFRSCSTSLIPKGSIVFSKRAPIGTVSINTEVLCTNQGCLSCISKIDVSNDYYYYVMSIGTEHFELLGSGTTFKEISANSFANCKLPFPSKENQSAIAKYLDEKCTEIDLLISDIQQQIETLEQYKRSVITEAVTKGLNPNVETKDSGVEWIGKIPKNWSVTKITRILDPTHQYAIGDGDHGIIKADDYVEEGIPYIRVNNLGWATDLLLENVVYITNEQNELIKSSTLKPGDILFAKTGATIGKTGIIPDSLPIANTTSHVGKITVSKDHYAKYFFYVLSSYVGFKQFWDFASLKTTRPELSIDEIKQIILTTPQFYSEQKKIADYLDNKCAEIDAIISEKKQQIETIEEYKKSLIFEYVTGKKEVQA